MQLLPGCLHVRLLLVKDLFFFKEFKFMSRNNSNYLQ